MVFFELIVLYIWRLFFCVDLFMFIMRGNFIRIMLVCFMGLFERVYIECFKFYGKKYLLKIFFFILVLFLNVIFLCNFNWGEGVVVSLIENI